MEILIFADGFNPELNRKNLHYTDRSFTGGPFVARAQQMELSSARVK
jgi:hypothetical protein